MKSGKNTWIGSALLAGVLAYGLYGMGVSVASSGYAEGRYFGHDDDDHYRGRGMMQGAGYDLYRQECGSCHVAYPPQLLPNASWQKMLGQLDDHFGENAELDSDTTQQLSAFLQEQSRYSTNGRWFRGIRDIPLRITDLPYFKHEHDEIPLSYIKGNDKVASLSQCDACHTRAQQGDFDEDNIRIPGIGRWHD